jgi:hypothetical protein
LSPAVGGRRFGPREPAGTWRAFSSARSRENRPSSRLTRGTFRSAYPFKRPLSCPSAERRPDSVLDEEVDERVGHRSGMRERREVACAGDLRVTRAGDAGSRLAGAGRR